MGSFNEGIELGASRRMLLVTALSLLVILTDLRSPGAPVAGVEETHPLVGPPWPFETLHSLQQLEFRLQPGKPGKQSRQ